MSHPETSLNRPVWSALNSRQRRFALGARLSAQVAARIEARGDRPILHACADNAGAIRLYERLGFTLRARGNAAVGAAARPEHLTYGNYPS